jgi:sec-independent protein translocase protein TatA
METTLLFLGGVGVQEILVIGAVLLVLFGAKRVPEFMKGLGKGVKEFKDGVKEVQKDMVMLSLSWQCIRPGRI